MRKSIKSSQEKAEVAVDEMAAIINERVLEPAQRAGKVLTDTAQRVVAKIRMMTTTPREQDTLMEQFITVLWANLAKERKTRNPSH